jgi:hypothetical protein
MKAMALEGYGGLEQLELREIAGLPPLDVIADPVRPRDCREAGRAAEAGRDLG